MKLVRCAKRKHYYDSSKYSYCPECMAKDGTVEEKPTIPKTIKRSPYWEENGTVALGGASDKETVFTDEDVSKENKAESYEKSPESTSDNETVFTNEEISPEAPNTSYEEAPESSSDNETVFTNEEISPEASNTSYEETPESPSDNETVFTNEEISPEASNTSYEETPESPSANETVFTEESDEFSESDGGETIFGGGIYSDMVMGWLVCVKGEYMGESFQIRSGQNFIGRDKSMDICLEKDQTVSRRNHSAVIFDPESCGFFVTPGQSSGLSYLNGQLLMMPSKLKQYDEIKIGSGMYVFVPLCGKDFSWSKYLG